MNLSIPTSGIKMKVIIWECVLNKAKRHERKEINNYWQEEGDESKKNGRKKTEMAKGEHNKSRNFQNERTGNERKVLQQ